MERLISEVDNESTYLIKLSILKKIYYIYIAIVKVNELRDVKDLGNFQKYKYVYIIDYIDYLTNHGEKELDMTMFKLLNNYYDNCAEIDIFLKYYEYVNKDIEKVNRCTQKLMVLISILIFFNLSFSL